MDFKDHIKQLGDKVKKTKNQVTTEEATKNAFIMPFIKELGYDIFNPLEVVPEFNADIGIKKGEKIDYAILKDGAPILLIECKCHSSLLNIKNESQLIRYFQAAKVKFAILTNGIEYRFYTDLVKDNIMDEKPFFSFDITEIKDNEILELKKFHKDEFNFDNIINTATDLKYIIELKKLILSNIENPAPDFVKFFTKQVYDGFLNQKVLSQFTELVKKSFSQQISDAVTKRLEGALNKEKEVQSEEKVQIKTSKILTTQEELDAFYIVRAICCAKIKQNRVVHRDAQSYFAILFDDNNRKAICRLYFTETKKEIGFFDKKDDTFTKHKLVSIEDIYKYSDDLLKVVDFHLNN